MPSWCGGTWTWSTPRPGGNCATRATPLEAGQDPWLEALLGFAQVDDAGRPDSLPPSESPIEVPDSEPWQRLQQRLQKLLRLR